MKRLIALLLILILILCGCKVCTQESQSDYRVVTSVSIVHQLGDARAQREYFSEDNISMVLTYLRLLRTTGMPEEDPEQQGGGIYRITLSLSDGKQKEYVQKADRYLWEEGVGWRLIDEEQAPQLGQLFRAIPSDPEFSQKTGLLTKEWPAQTVPRTNAPDLPALPPRSAW